MRIGVVTYGIHGERMTGIARYAVELTRAMARIDPSHEIILLNPYPDDPHPWYADYRIYPLPQLSLLPFAATVGNIQLHHVAKKLALDVLFDPTGIAPFLMFDGSYVRAVTIHDAIPFIFPETQPLPTRAVFRTLVAAARRSADVILTVSNSASKDLQEHAGFRTDQIHVVPLAAGDPAEMDAPEVERILETMKVSRPYLLFVGALHPRKNLPRVIEAFEKLRMEQALAAQLVIVGPRSWGAHDTLRAVIEASGSDRDDRIAYTGFVTDGELNALYRGARGLVFPSLYEGFGLPVLEAMRRGTAVITSDRSSLPEVAGDAVILVDPENVASIAQAMDALLRDDALRDSMVERGLRRAETFTWERSAEATLDAFNRTHRKRTANQGSRRGPLA